MCAACSRADSAWRRSACLLSRWWQQCVAQARMAAPEGQTIELESRERAHSFVEGDALRLEQVIMNLLSNAMTYAPHSPRIQVRLRREGNEAVVEVQDTGPGIPAADLPHIFERFYQSTSTEERPSRRGLGLGLYIAHELVAAHGGRLEVSSVMAPNQGHGTTFTDPPAACSAGRERASGSRASWPPIWGQRAR